jgi:hypothetical protein
MLVLPDLKRMTVTQKAHQKPRGERPSVRAMAPKTGHPNQVPQRLLEPTKGRLMALPMGSLMVCPRELSKVQPKVRGTAHQIQEVPKCLAVVTVLK